MTQKQIHQATTKQNFTSWNREKYFTWNEIEQEVLQQRNGTTCQFTVGPQKLLYTPPPQELLLLRYLLSLRFSHPPMRPWAIINKSTPKRTKTPQ